MDAKIDIRKIDKQAISDWLSAQGEPRFRVKQIYAWLWEKSVVDFDQMHNVPKALKEKLKESFFIRAIREDLTQESNDGTVKSRFSLYDGHKIESVLIPVPSDRRFTVCVSTQVGCSLTCSFCATGKMKRERNLDPGEIYDQVVWMNRICQKQFGYPITNIVYMGMGEPLLNYANTLASIDRITNPDGLGMSPRRITVSTAGIAKMIKRLADDEVKFNLALSLHAADDVKRNEIMPINQQNNVEVLMDSLVYFYRKTRNQISYEYIALRNFNDTLEDARALVKLCKHFPVKVNIIEYNTIEDGIFQKSDPEKIDNFAQELRKNRVMVTVRRSRGKDIDAACGQLANKA